MPDWDWLWSADVEPFPNAVRAARFPHSENLGDVLADDFLDRAAAFGPLDVLVGGPPCQDFSIAGLRAGLNGARGNLTLRWVQIIHALRPVWAVTENVPGWLSVNGGHAFGAFLAGLVGHDTALIPGKECGGRWTDAGMVAGPAGRAAWRILDAQHFGLAQRRRRVFVVFSAGDGGDPAAVLFERAGVRRNSAARGEAGEDIARCLVRGSGGGQRYDGESETLLPVQCVTGEITHALTTRCGGRNAGEDGTGRGTPLVPVAFNNTGAGWWNDAETAATVRKGDDGGNGGARESTLVAFHPTQDPISSTGVCHALGTGSRGGQASAAIAFAENSRAELRFEGGDGHTVGALKVGGGKPGQSYPAAMVGSAVRRLTPTECERLQGFPDSWTAIQQRGKEATDGPRYKSLGNSMAVPVLRWIGQRIAAQAE